MVYNIRIAQITKHPTTDKTAKAKEVKVETLVFDQFHKKMNGIKQNFVGAFGSLLYNFKPYYLRGDLAVSNIHETTKMSPGFSGTETDDLLLSGGRNFIINKHNDITLSGLFSIPTHRMYRLQHTDFGYSQVGMGLQLDGLHAFSETSSMISAIRNVYFIPRIALDNTLTKHTFTLGNIADIMIGYKQHWPHHDIELGYSLEFSYRAKISPTLDDNDIVKKLTIPEAVFTPPTNINS